MCETGQRGVPYRTHKYGEEHSTVRQAFVSLEILLILLFGIFIALEEMMPNLLAKNPGDFGT